MPPFPQSPGWPVGIAVKPQVRERPAAFLDRDGVLNVDAGFAHRPEHLVFTPTAVEAVLALNRASYLVLVVTNQSGVARGYFGTAHVEAFHRSMAERMLERGATIDAFYYCPYHPEGSVPRFALEHEDRKPRPGMITRAMREWPVRRQGSVLFGDRPSDLAAAAAAGIGGVLVEANTCDLHAHVAAFLRSVDAGQEARS